MNGLLRADCARCAALCCVSLAFERSELFAFDKPAGEACPHLGPHHRCRIHGSRASRGFGGCVGYDCLGAGQRVTQEVFGGRSWEDHPELLGSMVEAFRLMRQVHEWLVLLEAAARWSLTTEQSRTVEALRRSLTPADGWSLERLAELELGPIPARMRAFLAGLRRCVRPERDRLALPVL